jgi:hypothetical protein
MAGRSFAGAAHYGYGGGRVAYGGAHYGYGGGYGYRGYGGGVHGWYGHPWGGGYWGGVWWPAAAYGLGFAWFLPWLPAYAPVYWWGGVPYYYYDNGYYTWDQTDNGYVATDPPPIASGDGSGAATGPQQAGPPPGAGGAAAEAGPNTDDLYAYPKNGQSEQQQGSDRRECEQWASSQTSNAGSSAPGGAPQAAGPVGYRRAIAACLEGRGYSVQ